MKWSESTTIEFVRIYLKHECLWNPSHGAYTLKYKRERAYAAISGEFKDFSGKSMSVPEVKNKIKNLRTTYSQEVHKILNKSSPDSIYEPSLAWFKEMDRCLKYVSNKRQSISYFNNYINNDTTEVDSSSHSIWAEEANQTLHDFDDGNPDPLVSQNITDNEYEMIVPDESLSIMKIEPSQCRNKRVKKKKKNKPIQTYEVDSMSERVARDDEFDIYGKFIATQLRKMELNSALKTQLAIQNLLSKARLSE